MQNVQRTIAVIIACVCAGVFAGPAAANVVTYREIFPNDSGSDELLSGEGWQINHDAGAATPTQINSGTNGTPTDATPVNSSPSVGELARGYAFNNDTNGVDYLFWSDEYTVDRSAEEVTEISWYQANEIASDASRAAIEVGGQWYVSDETFTQASGKFNGATAEQMTLDFATAGWRDLDFVDGSSLAMGSATTLPTNNITGFGVFFENKTGRLRIDTYAISVVPAPAALPAGLALLGVTMLRRRR